MKKISLLFLSTLISCITLFASIQQVNGIYYSLDSALTATVVKDTINGYQGITEVVIPSTITSEGVTYTVTAIGYSAFSGCSALTAIELPNTLEEIDLLAFNATGLSHITLPSSITYVGFNSFAECSALESVNISDGITTVFDMLFAQCPALTTLELGKDVQTIAMMAFFNSASLAKITCHAVVPPSVGMMAFSGSITSTAVLYVPEASIDAYKEASTWKNFLNIKAIGDTTSTTPIITIIEVEDIFYQLNLEKHTATVVRDTINNYQTIVDLVIPETVTYEGVDYTITNIGDEALAGCEALTTIELPSTLEEIGMIAFLNSPKINKVTCHAVVPPTFKVTAIDVFLDSVCSVSTLIVPAGSVDAYKNARFWKDFANIITIPTGPTTSLDNQTEQNVLIYSNGNTIYFDGLSTEYQVFNVTGNLIHKGSEVSLTLPNGTYIVCINNQIVKIIL